MPVDSKSGYDSSIREELQKADWDDALARALKYAHWKSKMFSWLGFEVDPEGLVNEAIARAFGVGTGKDGNTTYRNWNKERFPNLADFLISIVDSIVSHIAEHHSKFAFSSMDETDEEKDDASRLEFEAQSTSDFIRPRSPEELVLLKEKTTSLRLFMDSLSDEDEEIGMVLMAMEDGIEKPADIADATGYEVTKVYTITKRLRRKFLEFPASNPANGQGRKS